MREVPSLSSADVTVLRRGHTVLTGIPADVGEAAVIEAMVGAATATIASATPNDSPPGAIVASLHDVSVADDRGVPRLRAATMDVRAGEIVGVAGVEGSGQHELLRVIAGRLTPGSGTVRVPSRIGFVPEDRLRDALIPAMTLVENFALKDAGTRRGTMLWTAYASRTESAIAAHDVRASGADVPAGALSGGNQQKFVLARELEGSPALLVVENPTRGLDIRAAAHVLSELRSARAAGVAVAVYSSDLEEVLSIADRMIVCFDGRITATAVDAAAVARAVVGLS